jgi:tRNA A-37 threonylcarbamoyl transferase component Bud32
MYFKVIQVDLDEPHQKMEKSYLRQASNVKCHTPILYFIDEDQNFLKYMIYENDKPKFNKMEDVKGTFHPIKFNT